jgi:hypothetical protein
MQALSQPATGRFIAIPTLAVVSRRKGWTFTRTSRWLHGRGCGRGCMILALSAHRSI